MRKRTYILEVYRNKAYRKVFAGKESQCYKRLQSVTGRYRIRAI